jgi:NhaP-type Na+/H+ or K+/H+ antiporter
MSGVALIALLFVGYGAFSRRLAHSPITGPMLFTLAGVLAAFVLTRQGLSAQMMSIELQSNMVQTLLEGTLIIILFSDAVVIDMRAVRREAFLPSRLLGIGLPLTIGLGAVLFMVVFPEIGFWPAAVVAVILAPTDAALGQAVIQNENVPDLVRQGLGVESGLNDGIVVPFLTIAIAGAANDMQSGAEIARVFVEEIGLAIIVGIGVGWLGGLVVKYVYSRGWMSREWRQVTVVSLAVLCFALADPVGGSGFIAAFVGGLVFGAIVRRDYPDICNFSNAIGHLLTMLAFFVFGLLILEPALGSITWATVVYAVLSLTVVRMIPVLLALLGTGLKAPTFLYIGWFGPRGLASLVFMATVVVDLDQESAKAIVAVAATTVGLSVLLHGITAWPGSQRYASWYNRSRVTEGVEEMPESQTIEHMPSPMIQNRMGQQLDSPRLRLGDD